MTRHRQPEELRGLGLKRSWRKHLGELHTGTQRGDGGEVWIGMTGVWMRAWHGVAATSRVFQRLPAALRAVERWLDKQAKGKKERGR